MKFRKKPLVVEAIQWTGDNIDEIRAFVGSSASSYPGQIAGRIVTLLDIKTMKGELRATPSDWIIKGTAGEFYPCKAAIFAEIYEPIEEAA